MRVAAFRIKNFRSIVDTGWVDLSPDGITALVGQNEAGKTSVLRAIEAFKGGSITPDDQRSDDTLPEVYLSFELEAPPSTMFKNLELPGDLDREVKEWGMRVKLLRLWNAQLEAIDPMLDPEQGLAELLPEEDADEVSESGLILRPSRRRSSRRSCSTTRQTSRSSAMRPACYPTTLTSPRFAGVRR